MSTNRGAGTRVSPAKRKRILERDRNHCRYCARSETKMTVDHVLPVILGGKANDDNLVVACHTCGQNKADNPISPISLEMLLGLIEGYRCCMDSPLRKVTRHVSKQPILKNQTIKYGGSMYESRWVAVCPGVRKYSFNSSCVIISGHLLKLGLNH